jgi:hypothetical protein
VRVLISWLPSTFCVALQTRHLLTCGLQSGRTSAPITPHLVQTIRRHKDRTGVSSDRQSAFMVAL